MGDEMEGGKLFAADICGNIFGVLPMRTADTHKYFMDALEAVAPEYRGALNQIALYLASILTGFATGDAMLYAVNPGRDREFKFLHIRDVIDWYADNRNPRNMFEMEAVGRHVLFLAGFIQLDIGPIVTSVGMHAFYSASRGEHDILVQLCQDLHRWQIVLANVRKYFESQKFDLNNYFSDERDWVSRVAAGHYPA